MKTYSTRILIVSFLFLGACETTADKETFALHEDNSCQAFKEFVRNYNREVNFHNSGVKHEHSDEPNDVLDLIFRSEDQNKTNSFKKLHKEKC